MQWVTYHPKRVAVAVTGVILLLLGILSMPAAAITIGGPSDCDDNAIIRCGAHSTAVLMSDYNASTYVQNVYADFGISPSDMANLPNTVMAGTVTKGGRVFVDGQSQPVATNALTGGRQNIAGSTPVTFRGSTFFRRPPSVSFQSPWLPAFVSMVNGRFQFAVIASCGNAVRATAVVKPVPQPTPAPTPAPTPPTPAAPTQTQSQAQAQSQSQQVVVQTPPATPAATPPTPAPATPTPTPTPVSKTLPNTGPGSILSLFVIATIAGMFGYRRFLLRS